VADHAVVERPTNGPDPKPPAPATRTAPPSTRRRWLLRLVLVLATAVLTLTVFRLLDSPVSDVTRPADHDGLDGTVLRPPYSLRDATLTDTTGVSAPLRDRLRAPVTLLFFGYTHCDDTCPTVLSNIASAKARLSDQEAAQVDTWFVTTDPARDDPQTIGSYLERFDPAFTGFTGPPDRLVATAASVHVAMEAGRALPSGGYEVIHGTPVLAVLPDGSVPVLWTEDTSAAQLAADLDKVLTTGAPAQGAGS
jgi:protein SCO1/2